MPWKRAFFICLVLLMNYLAMGGDPSAAKKMKQVEIGSIFSGSPVISLNEKEKAYIKERVIKFSKEEDPTEMAMLETASLGEPIQVFNIQLDKIRAYSPAKDHSEILSRTENLILPVGQKEGSADRLYIQAFIPLIQTATEKTKIRGYRAGLPRVKSHYGLLSYAIRELEDSHPRSADTLKYFVIRYPALARSFLAYRANDREVKIKVLQDGPGDLKKGRERSAEDVFAVLSKDANKDKDIEYDLAGSPLEEFRQFNRHQ